MNIKMTNQTKMIIITSDEDIIRQFSFKNSKNTHIIDLDTNQQITSTPIDNNNIINLELLTQLSGVNSNNDQVYKRALESSDPVRSKPVKVSKKSTDIICTVCGDYAIGYNYDALSCASCKAFFRRNANQNPEKIRCITGKNQCSVAHGAFRTCPKCRLNRCFAVGMRKDFIQSEEEKQRRKQRLEENRTMTSQSISTSESENLPSVSQPTSNTESFSPIFHEIDQLLMDADKVDDNILIHENTNLNEIEDISPGTLSFEDWIVIERIRSAFLLFFQNNNIEHSYAGVSDGTSALIFWSEVTSQIVVRYINFFRQIDEFENLNADDRFILIKYNLFHIFPLHKCFNYDRTTNRSLFEQNEAALRLKKFNILADDTNGLRESFSSLIASLAEVTEQDSILLSLLLIILLFSQGLSMCEGEPSLHDPLAVNRAQSHYTQILWKYLVNKQGEIQAYKQFTQLLTRILRIQPVVKRIREFLHVKLTTSNSLNKIAPLMQTVLHIS